MVVSMIRKGQPLEFVRVLEREDSRRGESWCKSLG